MSSHHSDGLQRTPGNPSRAHAGRGWVTASAVAAMGVYAWFAAGTRPFTWGANLACAIAFGVIGALAFRRPFEHVADRLRRRAPREAALGGVAAGGPLRSGAPPSGGFGSPPATAGSLLPWAVAAGIVVAWELATYLAGLGGHRPEFPTISSLYDEATRWRGVKALLFFLWLALGFGLFGR